ncbi:MULTISPECIES: MobF family relaxase [unclassified Stenotrophomonas]|uniref:MobF family relaxase n=1 Tax=unclassified Stenotrophomonas TaxID=196198 RepID=UPI00244899F1|nr:MULTISPECIES: MobF family relaxase [unclassified Stenotrophomonas]MDH0275227.1 relaxase domain-containing protein [Stenotrophomonas sp. GD04089]MDH1912836.1 relaxase domain-containing protein [Stenotrophomonas sp. GD03794]
MPFTEVVALAASTTALWEIKMISIGRINARGRKQNGEAVVDYLLAMEELSQGMKNAAERANSLAASEDGLASYYYDEKADAIQRWSGKLAADLGLEGKPVEKQAMLKLAEGFHPYTGEPLCKNAGEKPKDVEKIDRKTGKPKLDKDGNVILKSEGGHRVGFDLVTTPPKSVSIAFALGNDDEKLEILQAHRRANDVAMKFLESKIETRRGTQGVNVIGTEGMIIMQADHMGNRNLEPNIHTHNLCFGISKGVDGKYGTFDAQELYRHQKAADQIYKNELAMNLRELKYGIEQLREVDVLGEETANVSFEISGISRELIDLNSSRRAEILKYELEHGVDRQAACLATRQHKDEPAFDELQAMWTVTLNSIQQERAELVPSIQQLKSTGDKNMRIDEGAEILKRLHKTDSVFTECHLIEAIAKENMGKVRLPDVVEKVKEFKSRMQLVEIAPEKIAAADAGETLSRRNTEVRYAAGWMVEWEREIVSGVTARQGEEHQKIPLDKVEECIAAYESRKDFTVTGEQRNSVIHVTSKSGGVAVFTGGAGTGKTSVSDIYSDVFKADGRNMIGVCVSNKAASKLEAESGMPCKSVAKALSLLDRNMMTLTDKDVLVIDEAGMIDADQTRRLLSYAQIGGAKVILQGDEMQLQPIGAGSGMALAKVAVDDVQLTEIRRQKNAEDRMIAGLFYSRGPDGSIKHHKKGEKSRSETLLHGKAIFDALEARGCIDDYDTRDQAIDALVEDYMSSGASVDQRLVLGSTRKDVRDLNEKIRSAMASAGLVDSSAVSVSVVNKSDKYFIDLSPGDRIAFTKNDEKGLGVVNGDSGTLLSVEKGKSGGYDMVVRLRSETPAKDGKLVSFNTDSFNNIRHNYAVTIHDSQGQGKEDVFHLAHLGVMDNHSALVAFTRLTKGKYTMYGDTETIERIHERMGMERLKANATTEGILKDAKQIDKNHIALSQLRSSIEAFNGLDKKRDGQRIDNIQKTRKTINVFGLGS